MNWKASIGIAAVVIAAAVVLTWVWRDSVWRGRIEASARDTVIVVGPQAPIAPPETVLVSPNPAPAKPRPDLESRARADSLIAVVADKDSLIRVLLAPRGVEQVFEAKDPTGLEVSGTITVVHSPLEQHFLTQITLDSVRIPTQIVTVTQTVIEERSDWKLIGAIASAGITVGLFIGLTQR